MLCGVPSTPGAVDDGLIIPPNDGTFDASLVPKFCRPAIIPVEGAGAGCEGLIVEVRICVDGAGPIAAVVGDGNCEAALSGDIPGGEPIGEPCIPGAGRAYRHST